MRRTDELWVIPKGWRWIALGELLSEVQNGFACALTNAVDDGVLHLRPDNISSLGNIDFGRQVRIPQDLVDEGSLGLRSGDVLFNNTNSAELVGKSALVLDDLDASFSNHITRMRLKPIVDPVWVTLALNHLRRLGYFKLRATRWIGQAGIAAERLAAVPLPVPPLDQQRRLVPIFDELLHVHRQGENIRSQLPAVPHAAFQQLMSPLESQEVPSGWARVKLDEISDIQGGLTVSGSKRSRNPLQVPYLRVANVLRDRLDLSEIKQLQVTEAELERTRLMDSDLLLVEGHGNRGEVGRSALWDGSIGDCVHQNHLIRVRANPVEASPSFLNAVINSVIGRKGIWPLVRTTSGLNSISTTTVRNLVVVLPPMPDQMRFEEISRAAADLQAKLDRLDLMQSDLLDAVTWNTLHATS